MNNPPTTPPGQIRRSSINPPNAPVPGNRQPRPRTPTNQSTNKSTPDAPKKGGVKNLTKKRYILRKRVYKKSGGKKTKKSCSKK